MMTGGRGSFIGAGFRAGKQEDGGGDLETTNEPVVSIYLRLAEIWFISSAKRSEV